MSYGVKQRYPIADPLPRNIPFYLPSFYPGATNNPPPSYAFSLPFQVKPNGMILCCELLEAEINWSPVFPNLVTSVAQGDGLVFRRIGFDAHSDTVDGQQYQNAWGSSSSPETANNPYSKPSLLGVVDQCMGWVGPATTKTIGATAGEQAMLNMKDLNVRYTFGCKGAYPVVPSSQLKIWSFMLLGGNAANMPTDGYTPVITMTGNYPKVLTDFASVGESTTPLRTPVVSGRIWFRIVEITPMQHLLLCARYSNKDINTVQLINKYNTTTVAGSETGTLDYNVVSANPNPTAPLNPFFG